MKRDAAATQDKAEFLLKVAREEVASIKGNSPLARAKLRQAANKGWMALATGADSYLLKKEGRVERKFREDFAPKPAGANYGYRAGDGLDPEPDLNHYGGPRR